MLSVDELGDGWRPTAARRGRRCDATDPAWKQARATAVSAFALGHNVLKQTVAVFADEEAAQGSFTVLESAGARRCLYRDLRRGIARAADTRVGPVRTIRIDEEAPQTQAVRAATTVESVVGLTSLYIDQVRVRAQRAVSVVLMIQLGTPFDEQTYDAIAGRLERRVSSSFY